MSRPLNAIIKSTGEKVILVKEDSGTLFEDFYCNCDHSKYYGKDEVEIHESVEPISVTLTEKETVAFCEFCKEHRHVGTRTGAIGGSHSIILTGTGIGWGVQAKCNLCGDVKDITDYGCW